MSADERTRLRALCSVDADPVRVLRSDLADLLDALDAAERDLDVMRRQQEPLLASHDALVRAAALPGAGASAEERVAAVVARARREGAEAMQRALDNAVVTLACGADVDAGLGADRDDEQAEKAHGYDRVLTVLRALPLPGDAEVSRGE